MNNLRFVELMNKINDKITILKDNPQDDIIYNEIQKYLLELDSLIQNNKIPNDVYQIVNEYHDKCHYEIEKLRPNIGQKRGK